MLATIKSKEVQKLKKSLVKRKAKIKTKAASQKPLSKSYKKRLRLRTRQNKALRRRKARLKEQCLLDAKEAKESNVEVKEVQQVVQSKPINRLLNTNYTNHVDLKFKHMVTKACSRIILKLRTK